MRNNVCWLSKAKNIICLILTFTFVLSSCVISYAANSYQTYSYTAFSMRARPTPDAYVPRKTIDGAALGLGELSGIKDTFVDKDENLYFVEAGANRIVCLDKDYNLKYTITEFDNNGVTDTFKTPSGIFVTEEGHIYIADTDHARIIELDADRNFIREIGAPKSDLMQTTINYMPKSLALDKSGRIYVVSSNVNQGLLQLNALGEFEGYMGAPKVSYSPIDYFWKTILTQEQRERMISFVPSEYNNLAIDDEGFIFVTMSAIDIGDFYTMLFSFDKTVWQKTTPIRRLNPSGEDVLLRSSQWPVVGEIDFDEGGDQSKAGPSLIVDVALGPEGTYTLLDAKRGRLFTYNKEGYNLFVFGGMGDQFGIFGNPSSVTYKGSDIVVSDYVTGQLTVFARTEYGDNLVEAIGYYNNFDYENSAKKWDELLQFNPSLSIAQVGKANTLVREKEYEEAMEIYRKAFDDVGYNKAFKHYRNELVSKWFFVVILAIFLILFGIGKMFGFAGKFTTDEKYRKYRHKTIGQMMYAFRFIFHPFDATWEMKHENRASVKSANIVLGIAILVMILASFFKGFLFIYDIDDAIYTITNTIIGTIIPILLWVTANWCLTTLMDGEGKFKDIYIVTVYSLLPLILSSLINIGLSYVLTSDERVFYDIVANAGALWMVLLILLGSISIHQYSFGKGVFTAGLSVVGMGVIMFVVLLILGTLSKIISFGGGIVTEILYRL